MDTDSMNGAPRHPRAPRRQAGARRLRRDLHHGRRSNLVRQEVELAKIEVTEAASAKAKGVGLLVAGGVMALFGLGFIAAAGSAALDLVLPRWAAHLIVAAVFVLITGDVVMIGKSALKQPAKPELTQKTLKEDADGRNNSSEGEPGDQGRRRAKTTAAQKATEISDPHATRGRPPGARRPDPAPLRSMKSLIALPGPDDRRSHRDEAAARQEEQERREKAEVVNRVMRDDVEVNATADLAGEGPDADRPGAGPIELPSGQS